MRRARVAERLFALAGYALAAFVITARVWSDPAHSWPGGPGDPYKFMDFLGWVPHAIGAHQNPFRMNVIDYPRGVNLAWETPVPLAGVVFWPVTALFGAVAAYNVSFLSALTLDGFCSYLWLKRHVRSGWAAFAAGLLAEVGPFAAAHSEGHLNMIWFAPIPLLFIALEKLLDGRSSPWKLGVGAGLLAAAQLYLAEELLAIFVIAAVVVVVVAVALRPGEVVGRIPRASAALGAAALVFAVLTGPMLLYQFRGPYQIHGPIQETNLYVTDLANLVIPTGFTWLHPGGVLGAQPARWSGNTVEQTGYLGLPLLALCLYVAVRWWNELRVRVVSIAAAILLILSFGPSLHVRGRNTIPLPGAVFDHVPVLDNLLPGRLSLVVAFGALFLLAIALDRTLLAAPHRAIGASTLGFASILTLLPVAPLTASSLSTPAYFAAGGDVTRLPADSVAVIAPFVNADGNSAVAMVWQANSDYRFSLIDAVALTVDASGKPVSWLVSPLQRAFSGIESAGDIPPETPGLRAQLRTEMAQHGVSVIIVAPMPHADQAVAFVSWLEGSNGREDQGVRVWNAASAQ